MSAIITDQFRILNAKNFVSAASSSENSYYSFIGLTNATDYEYTWNINPPTPKDSFEQEDDYWDTMVALKKLSPEDVQLVVKKTVWQSGTTYDMYRHDISRTKPSKPSGATSLYDANYFILTQDYRVYICLSNGTDPDNPEGRPSLDEPTFTDLEPREAGDSGDGYVWKYLYTIKPKEIVKFDSSFFMPVPIDWDTNLEYLPIINEAETSGQIKIITVTNRGSGIGTANRTYTKVPIKGDGSGGEATIVIGNDAKVDTVIVTKGGQDYTYGTLDLVSGNVPTGAVSPSFDVIIPPKGGHGYNIYRELGSYNVLFYSRIENDLQNPDFIIGNQIARLGIIENPKAYNSNNNLLLQKASALYALKLTGTGATTAVFPADGFITQTIGIGTTAVGRVVSYDQNTGVIKYWQDKSLVGFNSDGTRNPNPTYGFNMNRFTASPGDGGTINIFGGNVILGIDTNFTGVSTVINSRTYYFGQSFTNGVADPEVEKYSGNIIFVDNRPSVTRSLNQKEDIKVILQF